MGRHRPRAVSRLLLENPRGRVRAWQTSRLLKSRSNAHHFCCGLLISPRTPSKDEKNSASAKQKNERSRSLFVGYFLFCVLSCGCSLGTLPNEGCMQKDCVTNPKARFVPYFILGTDHYSFRLSNYYQKKTRVRALQPCPVFWFKQILAQAFPHQKISSTAHCVYYPSNLSRNTRSFENWEIFSDIPQFQSGNIRPRNVFKPIASEQKYLMDYNYQLFTGVEAASGGYLPSL